MVIVLVDDLGESGIEMNNPHVLGARVQELREDGVYLSRHYVYKFCSPTRGSLLSGRYPFRLGNTRSNFIPWSRPDGLELAFDTLPLRLRRLGYRTHHVGKWHLGFYNASYLPVNRGYDSYFGYLTGMQDHFTQQLKGFSDCNKVVDLTNGTRPAHEANGTYGGWLYSDAAVAVVRAAAADPRAAPFFLNYWLQNTHGPFEVPSRYSALYNFSDAKLRVFNGMVSAVDEAVGNLTKALRDGGLWANTLVVYTQDNGAPLGHGGSNFPLRGGKNSNFEGGVRVPTLFSGGAVPAGRRGASTDALFHVSDWLPTLVHAAAGASPEPLSDAVSGTIPYDGIDQWTLLTSGGAGRRGEIVLDHCPEGYGMSGTGCNHYQFARAGGVGALIVGEWKLVAGPNGGEWSSRSNGTKCQSFGGRACDGACLFHLPTDVGEHSDLASAEPDVLQRLLARFDALKAEYHPPAANPPAENAAMCAAAAAAGGFLTPWHGSA